MAISLAIKQAVNERAIDPGVRVGQLLLAGRDPTGMGAVDAVGGADPTGAEWSIDAFAASRGVSRAVAAALLHVDPSADQFELAKSFASQEEIAERLRAGALVEHVAGLLWLGVQKLKAAQAATAAQLNAKFAADGDAFKGEMGFGGTEEFYAGAAGWQGRCLERGGEG